MFDNSYLNFIAHQHANSALLIRLFAYVSVQCFYYIETAVRFVNFSTVW